MKIFKKNIDLLKWNVENKNIGFVPTMGALHEGHLSLIRNSKKECEKTIVSIFVNKLQFGPDGDFKKYPRTLERDLALLKKEKIDALYIPNPKEMYPQKPSFQINEVNVSQYLEGAARPDFFSGVLMVVLKLFNLIQPTHVYFGQKDIQQLYIIKKMLSELNFPIKMREGKTIRDSNGLALSSRNQYLSKAEKEEASVIYKTLKKSEHLINSGEEINTIKTFIKKRLTNHKMKIDYISIADIDTFQELNTLNRRISIVISVAVWFATIRLIDNIIIQKT
ncbi:pantoate--beta-alanine ligase [Candidatus Marinimicrobia bacterium]|nr:pantoate--beta-alanine ligase [Candidatus Neomarinimicrobiota bacterium]